MSTLGARASLDALLLSVDRGTLTAGGIIAQLRRDGYRLVSPLTIEERPSGRPWCVTRHGRLTIDATTLHAEADIDRRILAEFGFDARRYADTDICHDIMMDALLPILRSAP